MQQTEDTVEGTVDGAATTQHYHDAVRHVWEATSKNPNRVTKGDENRIVCEGKRPEQSKGQEERKRDRRKNSQNEINMNLWKKTVL
jgi:hypothetical protein